MGDAEIASDDATQAGSESETTSNWIWYFRHRVVVAELAFSLGVPPEPNALYRAANLQRALLEVPRPFRDEKGKYDKDEETEYRKQCDALLAKQWTAPRGSHRWNHALRGERGFSQRTLDDIGYLSLSAGYLWENILWPICALQPTGSAHYVELITDVETKIPIRGATRWDRPRTPLPRPPDTLLKQIGSCDTLDSVSASLLILGAADQEGWSDLYDYSYQTLLGALTRIACVPPFAQIGVDFSVHLVETALRGRTRVPSYNGLDVAKRIAENLKIVDLANRAGVFVSTEAISRGRRDETLALLRFADDKGHAQVRRALNSWKKAGHRSPIGRQLLKRLNNALDHLF